MHSRRGCDDRLCRRVVELAHAIAERSSGIDHTLGFDVPLLASDVVTETSTSALALAVLVQGDDLRVVGCHGALVYGSHHERDVHARVVVLSIVVD